MGFKLYTARNHVKGTQIQRWGIDTDGVTQQLLRSIYTALQGSSERPYTETGWTLEYRGTSSGNVTTGTTASSMYGVAIGDGSSNENHSYVQGYKHETTGAKLLLCSVAYGDFPFHSSLWLDADLEPRGLSIMYVPPDKAATLEWPTSDGRATWGIGSGLKFMPLANFDKNGAEYGTNLCEIPEPKIINQLSILCSGDTIGFIQNLYLNDGSDDFTKVADYWPAQRMVGFFAGKIFNVMGDEEDSQKYGSFMLQPNSNRREFDLPNGLGFGLKKPSVRLSKSTKSYCPFIWWDKNGNLQYQDVMYSYDTNIIQAMSTNGYRYVPLAVGQKKASPSANDLKGYLDTELFRMVAANIASGTLIANNTFNVFGGGLAIAWKSSNENFLAVGRPNSYSNNLGIVGEAATINNNPLFDMQLVEEYTSPV